MARTPNKTTPPADEPALNETALATLQAAPQQLAVAHEAMDEVLAAGIDLGRLEALDFVVTVTSTAILPIYENVKNIVGKKSEEIFPKEIALQFEKNYRKN